MPRRQTSGQPTTPPRARPGGRRQAESAPAEEMAEAVAQSLCRAVQMSECGQYRYRMTRQWDTAPDSLVSPQLTASPAACFIMLNPSTADADIDDPTVRRCIAFAVRLGCRRLEIVNLFAWRTPSPLDLWAQAKLIGCDGICGPENGDAIMDAVDSADIVVVAWGAGASSPEAADRAAEVLEMLRRTGRAAMCLGVTDEGHPRHPLYLPAGTELVPFVTAAVEIG